MNGNEPLPGLLDDSEFQFPQLPALAGFHIAPLRNPVPSRNGKVPHLLEPVTTTLEDNSRSVKKALHLEDEHEQSSTTTHTRSADVLSSREAKKPHLAISELVDVSQDAHLQVLQLPSFVSLSAVEKSPIPQPSSIESHKRPRLDPESETAHHEVNRLLPRPAKKDDKKTRPVPLLPAMVTGLHEPPPSAGLLPSMDLDARPTLTRRPTSKIEVKDILSESKQASNRRPPEAMLNSPEIPKVLIDTVAALTDYEPGKSTQQEDKDELDQSVRGPPQSDSTGLQVESKSTESTTTEQTKVGRRKRRKWTDEETADLIAGVALHGVGHWAKILADTSYSFNDRTPSDLKDRYRVYPKDENGVPLPVSGEKAPITTNERSKSVQYNKDPSRRYTPWTEEESQSLMRGILKHGYQWTAIHDDPEFNLGHRKATDLRNRARKSPLTMYAEAAPRLYRPRAKREGVDESLIEAVDEGCGERQKAAASGSGGNVQGSLRTDGKSGTKAIMTETTSAQQSEHVGVTLPSLDLEDVVMDWGDMTLPPLLEWEDLGM